MNAERLHALGIAVQDDLEQTSLVPTLQQLRDALRNQVNAPQDANFQQQVATTLDRLLTALAAAPSNSFPPTWLQVEEELGIDHLLGERLGVTIRGIFERNQITPSVAADEIDRLYAEVEALATQLTALLGAFEHFHVGAEELQPGRAEVAVLIPRPAVGNQLSRLGAEFQELHRLLGPFLELGTGSRPSVEVVSISATDFGVFIDLAPKAAAFLAVAVERLIGAYKNLLEIRKLRHEMNEQGVPTDRLAGIDEHANSVMSDRIEEITAELVMEASSRVDAGRQNELRVELRLALNGIANRIDVGYNIDVRAGSAAAESDTGPDDTEALQKIRNASINLRFLNRSGKPILSLEEGPPDGQFRPE